MFKNSYFSNKELSCKCCGVNKIDDDFLALLIDIREHAKIPFIINSAYRCEEHNKAVGGAKNSKHLKGLAVDIAYKDSIELHKIIKSILDFDTLGKSRILIYKSFVHFDYDLATKEPIIKLM
ncbi:D-Ala-D-Ala carboxypeptidase family metallohydrolase [Campylobacter hyointestinalis]|uniref:D-Ala-D-Ala carboxypeptidase family metallohydrolase n=1 Tax=Campylobacter hyointestinalis TaxID=198 RepID=UPI000DCF1E25|nr:D-Ala-D-Ala carboxypeptidase family metallohydrolase [Campylobacter hyointestinalis]RAZ57416.1 peptidase M15 [Campylobacter hyointestinalis subsp. lawsonii]RAZ64971.1 peptidase M15 [Campylobacter hyointestinalis subsp. lawsonii]